MNVTLRCDIFIWGEFGYGGCSCAKQRVDGENLRRFGFGLTLFVCLFVYCHTFLQGLLCKTGDGGAAQPPLGGAGAPRPTRREVAVVPDRLRAAPAAGGTRRAVGHRAKPS